MKERGNGMLPKFSQRADLNTEASLELLTVKQNFVHKKNFRLLFHYYSCLKQRQYAYVYKNYTNENYILTTKNEPQKYSDEFNYSCKINLCFQ